MSRMSATDRLKKISGGKPTVDVTKAEPPKEIIEKKPKQARGKIKKEANAGKYFMLDPALILVLYKLQLKEQEQGNKKPSLSSLVEDAIKLLAKERGIKTE